MSNIQYTDVRYILDETPSSSLKPEWIKSQFFQSYCYIPEEIIYELRDNNRLNFEIIAQRSIPVTYEILNKLQQYVMPQIGKIVDLYKNEGNGDALLIATALEMRQMEDDKLIKSEWVIVTSDNGLASLAKRFDIRCISKNDFYRIIEDKFKTEQCA